MRRIRFGCITHSLNCRSTSVFLPVLRSVVCFVAVFCCYRSALATVMMFLGLYSVGSGVHRTVPIGVPAGAARPVVPLSQSPRSRGERFDLGQSGCSPLWLWLAQTLATVSVGWRLLAVCRSTRQRGYAKLGTFVRSQQIFSLAKSQCQKSALKIPTLNNFLAGCCNSICLVTSSVTGTSFRRLNQYISKVNMVLLLSSIPAF